MNYVGRPVDITVQGQTYTLARFSRRLMRRFLSWVSAQMGDPFADLHLDSLPPHLHKPLLEAAAEEAALKNSPGTGFQHYLVNSLEGKLYVLQLLTEDKHHLAAADVAMLYERACEQLGDDWLANCLIDCMGRVQTDPYDRELAYLRSVGLLPTPPPQPQRADNWLEIDRAIYQHAHLTPAQLDDMTLPEIIMFVQGLSEKQPMVGSDLGAYLKAMSLLTPEQKVDFYRASAG